MAAEIVNLRQARKRRDRARKEARAEENRQRFGRTGTQKNAESDRSERQRRHLDGHKRDDPDT